jgi:hypothetical protein
MTLTDDDAHKDYDCDHRSSMPEPSTPSIGRKNASESEKFDALGFASYLAPYAMAFVASLVVTAAFVKLVLMSY